jgi:flagellar M-ring protein FliF
MALVKTEAAAQGFTQLPAVRQLWFMIAIAASVAVGVSLVLWMQTPNYSLLYGNLSQKDAGQVVDALQKASIPFKVDEGSGAIMVASSQVHKARLELANQGLPAGSGMGFEILQEEQGFGTSQFIETARFQRALEGELARTIGTMRNVEAARVHLALPKRSVFVRERDNPTASVMVSLFSGRSLDEEQVASIVHMVSSSVPHLNPEAVTVVDQRGNLLTQPADRDRSAPSSSQFAYARKLEQSYVQRIENLLSPMVGAGGVRAQVTADLDFTVTERTQESYNPELAALRSEQLIEERMGRGGLAQGVPGALSNQPPAGGVAPEVAANATDPETATGAVANGANDALDGNSSRRSTRNFELDKTISHTRLASGTIRRLSVAVVLDDRPGAGGAAREPWAPEELERFTNLIREAVGFDAERGDSVNVINASFQQPEAFEPLPEPGLLEQPWVWEAARWAAGALGLLVLVFAVLRPALQQLAQAGARSAAMAPVPAAAGAGGVGEDQLSLSGAGGSSARQLKGPQDYQGNLTMAQGVVNEDPKRVAQVVKNWVNEDG